MTTSGSSLRRKFILVCCSGVGACLMVVAAASLYQAQRESALDGYSAFPDDRSYILGGIVAVVVGMLLGAVIGRSFGKAVHREEIKALDFDSRVPCPACAERILPEARVCPFCKTDLRSSGRVG